MIYEIFPRVFSPAGDLAGVTAQLDRLQDLGVSVLWLMPIHPIGHQRRKGTLGSPYAVRDYRAIDPDYGTEEDLRRLINQAHRRGLRIIIDIVANHTAWDSRLMEHPEFYTRGPSGDIVSPVPDWPDVADLDYRNPELRRYMIAMLVWWIREFDLDGFRCDVAGMVPTDFWEDAREALARIKLDIVLLAEWDSPELLVKAFDLDYAVDFHDALASVVRGLQPAAAIREAWYEERNRFPGGTLHLRYSDNHDKRRAVARFGEAGALAASALILTSDGVPLIYNGMEVGDATESAAPALFERTPILWQSGALRPTFPRFYREMLGLRRAHPALRQGRTRWLPNSDEERIVTYSRAGEGEEMLVAVNFSKWPFTGSAEAGAGDWLELTPPGLTEIAAGAPGRQGPPQIELGPWDFRVWLRAGQASTSSPNLREPSA